jgi:diadenosine tetraphosphatase ApaH/serine/threonine PP2A family protein phosphatase
MPLIAVLSDIHANVVALDAVLADAAERGATEHYCLGDITGYGPRPAECVRRIRELGCPAVLGNHDEAVAWPDRRATMNPYAMAGVRFSRKRLAPDARQWLAALPLMLKISPATLVHASPFEPEEWHYVFDAEDALAALGAQSTSIAFCGHTHVAGLFARRPGPQPEALHELKFRLPGRGKYLVNVGAVGQPRNNDPRAQYVLFNPRARTVEYRRVEYDVDRVFAEIRKAGLPEILGLRLFSGS